MGTDTKENIFKILVDDDWQEVSEFEEKKSKFLSMSIKTTYKILENDKLDEHERIKTLDELLNEGYSMREANEYFKNLEREVN